MDREWTQVFWALFVFLMLSAFFRPVFIQSSDCLWKSCSSQEEVQ